jgi:hypothetical protein
MNDFTGRVRIEDRKPPKGEERAVAALQTQLACFLSFALPKSEKWVFCSARQPRPGGLRRCGQVDRSSSVPTEVGGVCSFTALWPVAVQGLRGRTCCRWTPHNTSWTSMQRQLARRQTCMPPSTCSCAGTQRRTTSRCAVIRIISACMPECAAHGNVVV